MEREKFNAVMGVLVPQIISLITKNFDDSEISAINMFYASQVYSILEKEARNTGSFVIPEEI